MERLKIKTAGIPVQVETNHGTATFLRKYFTPRVKQSEVSEPGMLDFYTDDCSSYPIAR